MDEQAKETQVQETMQSAETSEPQRRGMSKPVYYSLIAIFAAVFILSGIYLVGYFLETGEAQQDYDALASMYQQATSPSRPSKPATRPSGTVPTEPPTILPELQAIYELNQDLVGYLNFPYSDMRLQYPVMQSQQDEDFYLSHDFYGNESMAGCPYVPLTCSVFEPSDNVVIYGHNLRTGGMFNKLRKYREKFFWETHQTFTFDTLYERHTYQVFAVFKTAAKQYTKDGKPWGYPYHRTNTFTDEAQFNSFIADIKGAAFNGGGYKGLAFYDTGITPEFGDKLLCLSTCEYTMQDPDGAINGRLVIMAVRID